jgi:hypothetical protein
MKITEADVLRACLDYLAARGIPAWRSNTGAAQYAGKVGTRFVRYGKKGQADITGLCAVEKKVGLSGAALHKGVRLEIECKRPGGKLSEHQEYFLAMINDAGGVGICVDNVESLQRQLRERGVE